MPRTEGIRRFVLVLGCHPEEAASPGEIQVTEGPIRFLGSSWGYLFIHFSH
jgi:hypothetical protein